MSRRSRLRRSCSPTPPPSPSASRSRCCTRCSARPSRSASCRAGPRCATTPTAATRRGLHERRTEPRRALRALREAARARQGRRRRRHRRRHLRRSSPPRGSSIQTASSPPLSSTIRRHRLRRLSSSFVIVVIVVRRGRRALRWRRRGRGRGICLGCLRAAASAGRERGALCRCHRQPPSATARWSRRRRRRRRRVIRHANGRRG